MNFRKYKGIRLSYEEQGLIHFICRNYRKMPAEIQLKILDLCELSSRENPYALFCLLTEGKSTTSVAQRFCIASESTLYEARKRFYDGWGAER